MNLEIFPLALRKSLFLGSWQANAVNIVLLSRQVLTLFLYQFYHSHLQAILSSDCSKILL
jgi:hypothetical protein